MWEKYFDIFMTLNIYVFKEILLNFKNLKISNCTKKILNYFCHVLVVFVSVVRKVSNPYILPFERYKKRI
jgi:hypothetical protein